MIKNCTNCMHNQLANYERDETAQCYATCAVAPLWEDGSRGFADVNFMNRPVEIGGCDGGTKFEPLLEIRLDNCDLCGMEVPKGETRCQACESVFSPFKGAN